MGSFSVDPVITMGTLQASTRSILLILALCMILFVASFLLNMNESFQKKKHYQISLLRSHAKRWEFGNKSDANGETLVPTQEGVCYFVRSNLKDTKLRERTQAVAETWGTNVPTGSSVFYMVDAHTDLKSVTTRAIHENQLVRIPAFGGFKYNELPKRTHSYLRFLDEHLDSTFPKCKWILTVDDDSYIDTTVVSNKLLIYDHEKSTIMGPVYGSGYGLFVHGHFTVFSRPGFRLARRAADMCDLTTRGTSEDVELQACIDLARKTVPTMPEPEGFGWSITDNTRGKENKIGQLVGKQLFKNPDKHRCVTDVHKLSAKEMRFYHQIRQGFEACDHMVVRVDNLDDT